MDAYLSSAIEDLRSARRLIDVQEIARSAARQVACADGATFVLREDDKCFYADEDAMSPLWKGQRFPISACISGWAMLHGETAVVPDITDDERIPLEAYRPTFVKSLAMVPVGEPTPVAAIGVYWARPHSPAPEELTNLEALAGAVGDALARIGFDEAPFIPASLRSTASG